MGYSSQTICRVSDFYSDKSWKGLEFFARLQKFGQKGRGKGCGSVESKSAGADGSGCGEQVGRPWTERVHQTPDGRIRPINNVLKTSRAMPQG